MKRYAILALALMVLVGFTLVSCESGREHHHMNKDKHGEKPIGQKESEQGGEQKDKPCQMAEGKGPCKECQEKADKMKEQKKGETAESEEEQANLNEKMQEEFEAMTNQAVDLLQAKDYTKGIAVLKSLDEKFPDNYIVNYNLACAYSLAGDKTNAMAVLHKAVQCGYCNWKHLDEDTDLNNIRNEGEYKKLRDALETVFSMTCSCNKDEHNAEAKETEEELKDDAQSGMASMSREQMIEMYTKMTNEALDALTAQDFKKGLALLKKLDRRIPNNSLINYNLACAYSLVGNKAEGICRLHKAMQYGWADWKHMDGDTDLNNIKGEGEYKQLRDALEILYPEGVRTISPAGNDEGCKCKDEDKTDTKMPEGCKGDCKDKK